MEPTAEELKIAEWIAAYEIHKSPTPWINLNDYRKIVEFLAERMCHEGAHWKNRVLFSLTGCDAICNYKD